jgi:hypothetical protein
MPIWEQTVDQNETSLMVKILWKHIYNNNHLQNIQTTIIKRHIKIAKTKSKLGLMKAVTFFTSK